MASKKRQVIEGLIPKKKKKYDVTETKSGDDPWWVKAGLGRKPKPKTKTKTKTKTPVLTAPKRTPQLPKLSRKGPIIGAAAITAGILAAPKKKKADSQKTVKFEGKTVPLLKGKAFKERPKGFVPGQTKAKTALKKPGIGRGKWVGKYKVSGGDSLSKIAKKFGVSLKSLLNANPKFKKNPNLIKVGQNIAVPEAKIKGTGTSIYKGMSKSAMAKMQKGPPPPKYPSKLKRQVGGRLGRMGGAGLSPAEMARAGVMSEEQRRREAMRGLYAKKGGKVGKKKGGTVNRKHGGQIGTAFVASSYD